MQFTGERVIPDETQIRPLYLEHFARYMYAAQFASGQKVLDLGCGTGYGAAYLALHKADQVVGVDVSAEAIQYACCHYQVQNLSYAVNDCLALSLKDQSFDVIVSFEVIEHIDAWQSYLLEAKRLLKPGGYLVGSTPNKRLYSPNTEISHNPFHVREYFLTDLREVLSKYFRDVWILGQSSLQGFLISENQSLRYLAQGHTLVKDTAMVLEDHNENEDIEWANYFIFICQKEDQSTDTSMGKPFPCQQGKIYLSEPISADFARAIELIKTQEAELIRLNERVRQFEKGRFIRFMVWIHHLKQKFMGK
jgi:2-polyprenyl-3-methyl-5-hydroxy-6-metoxy-1,4-benzoquinol methylase